MSGQDQEYCPASEPARDKPGDLERLIFVAGAYMDSLCGSWDEMDTDWSNRFVNMWKPKKPTDFLIFKKESSKSKRLEKEAARVRKRHKEFRRQEKIANAVIEELADRRFGPPARAPPSEASEESTPSLPDSDLLSEDAYSVGTEELEAAIEDTAPMEEWPFPEDEPIIEQAERPQDAQRQQEMQGHQLIEGVGENPPAEANAAPLLADDVGWEEFIPEHPNHREMFEQVNLFDDNNDDIGRALAALMRNPPNEQQIRAERRAEDQERWNQNPAAAARHRGFDLLEPEEAERIGHQLSVVTDRMRIADLLAATRRMTNKKWSRQLMMAMHAGMLGKWGKARKPKVHAWVTYFGVRKGRSGLDRAITSCKRLNSLLEKPPQFNLLNHPRISQILKDFPRPYMATADYKNYFYQLPLPEMVRSYFCIQQGPNLYHLKVLPMGYSWSPYLAQGVSSTVLYAARRLFSERRGPGFQNAQPAIPDDSFETVIRVKDSEGNCIAAMGVVYDNILIVAGSETTLRELIECVEVSNTKYNLKLKIDSKDTRAHQQRLPAGWDANIMEESINTRGGSKMGHTMSFTGIEYLYFSDTGVHFRHMRKNVSGWEEDFRAFSDAFFMSADGSFDVGQLSLNNRQVAHMVGVQIWDARVMAVPLSTLATALNDLSEIGKSVKGAESWNDNTPLSRERQNALLKAHREFLNRVAKLDYFKLRSHHKGVRQVYACSDSSSYMASGVILGELQATHSLQMTWSRKQLVKNSINWKETKVAIETIKHMISRWDRYFPGVPMKGTQIVFGEDNTTAMRALNAFHYPRELGIAGELLDLWHLLEARGLSLTSLYINTKLMPADEPSRGRKLIQEKCRLARQSLKNEVEENFMAPARNRE